MRSARFAQLAAIALFATACGGGGDSGGVTPPPPSNPTVSTIDISPASVTLLAPATQQFTAVAKDASGTPLARTFAWTSTSPSVATVSSSGLVTAVAAGTTTIVASVDGKQGSATVTVSASSDGPMLAKGDIGPAGGTLTSPEVAVSIPSGALAVPAALTLVRDTVHAPDFTEGAITANYLIDGLPDDRVVNVRVRLKATGAISGTAALAVTRPAVAFSDEADVVALGTTLIAAQDSAGYLVATVPLRGRPAAGWGASLDAAPGTGFGSSLRASVRPFAPANASVNKYDPRDLKAAAELSGLMNLTRLMSSKGNFELWAVGTMADRDAKLTRSATLLEQARDQVLAMGYAWSHRTSYPIQTYLSRGKTWYGAWYSPMPFPTDPNVGYMWLNPDVVMQSWFPGTIIHELFHFTQQYYSAGKPWAEVAPMRWFNEATSTWIQERHPAAPAPYNDPIAFSWRDSLWAGLSGGMVGSSGYGKAPMVKWLVKTYGDAKVRQIFTDVQNGAVPIAAFLSAFPGAREAWVPEYLKAQLGGQIYPFWHQDSLAPRPKNVQALAGKQEWITPTMLGLATTGTWIRRDTASFGPEFTLPVYLQPAARDAGTITAFRRAPGAATWTYVGTGDTVNFTPAMLRSTDTLLLLFTNVKAAPPYTASTTLPFVVDLSVPPGDLHMPTVTKQSDNTRFVCDQKGDTIAFDPTSNLTQLVEALSTIGTWKRTQENVQASPFATYAWSVYPLYADSLRLGGMTLQSTMQVRDQDSVVVNGRMTWTTNPAVFGGSVAPMQAVHLPWWLAGLLLVALGVLARTTRIRRVRSSAVLTALLLVVGCGSGLISITMDETFEVTFIKPRFTANPTKPNAMLLELRNGVGQTTINSYRLVHWVYFTNAAGKPDSVRGTCTGSGTARYTVSGSIYGDSVKVPSALSGATVGEQVARAMGIDVSRATPEVKARMQGLMMR